MPTKLREAQEKLWAKQDSFKRILEQSRLSDGSYDFTKADAFEHLDSQKQCIEQMEVMEKEMDEAANEVKTLEGMQAMEKRFQAKLEARREIETATPMIHSNGHSGNGSSPNGLVQKSLSDYVREAYPRDVKAGTGLVLDREFRGIDLKALMLTTTGFLPETTRIPRVQEFAHRPIQITDLFPVGQTDQPQIQWMNARPLDQ